MNIGELFLKPPSDALFQRTGNIEPQAVVLDMPKPKKDSEANNGTTVLKIKTTGDGEFTVIESSDELISVNSTIMRLTL